MENIVYNPSVDCYSLHQEMINHSLQGEILNVKIENDKLKNENNELKHKLKQAIKLLILSKKECIYNGVETWRKLWKDFLKWLIIIRKIWNFL